MSHQRESGVRPLSALPRGARPEEFEEPDAELISFVERATETPSTPPRPTTDSSYSALLTLEQQVSHLQCELDRVRAELRERDAELEELKGLLFPAAPRAPQSVPAQLTPAHASAAPARAQSLAPARPLSLRAPAARIGILTVGLRVLPASSEPASTPEQGLSEPVLEFTHQSELYSDLSGELEHGGIFIATYQCLALGTTVELEIQLSNGSASKLRGHVSWFRQEVPGEASPGMGIQFAPCSAAALGALRACYSLLPPRYFEA